MKAKIGTAIFLIVCLTVNIAALVKHYRLEEKAVETITNALITEISKEQKTITTATTHYTTEPPTTEQFTSLGMFTLTAYCPCTQCSGGWGNKTATGETATAGITIAVDPSVISYGTKVMIKGHTYIAEDCGGAVKGNVIDIYFDTHEQAVNFGKQYAEVFLVEG